MSDRPLKPTAPPPLCPVVGCARLILCYAPPFFRSRQRLDADHPDRNGEQLRKIAPVLKLFAETAKETGGKVGVFLDYCSLPQRAFPELPEEYFEANAGAKRGTDRTRGQLQLFSYAMWEMTRFYAFSQCQVIVDPVIDAPEDFPRGPSDIRPPEEPGGSRTCSWGYINDRPYEERGWVGATRIRSSALSTAPFLPFMPRAVPIPMLCSAAPSLPSPSATAGSPTCPTRSCRKSSSRANGRRT